MWRRLLTRLGIGRDEEAIVDYFIKKSTQALLQERYGAAIRYIDRALEFQPGANRLYLAKGIIYREGLGNLAEAMNCFKKAGSMPVRGDRENEMAKERAKEMIREIMRHSTEEKVEHDNERT